MPADDRQANRRIEHLSLARIEAVACQHLFRRTRGYVGKHRPTAGQSHAGRTRQVKDVVPIQEQPEHVRAADDANAGFLRAEGGKGLLEGCTRPVPEQRLVIGWIGGDRRDLPGQDQSAAPIGMRLLLMRVAAMHHRIDAVEPAFEEAPIGVEFEGIGHDADSICQHAILRDDGVAFDAARTRHGDH
ncbi:MAG TPA: hypothetical protein VGP48_05310 [Stellaceae bacterium]|nr:hypothetical protein [Stellaceae bacterium]